MDASGQVILLIVVWIVLTGALVLVMWRPIAPKDSALEKSQRFKPPIPVLKEAPKAQQDTSRPGGALVSDAPGARDDPGDDIDKPATLPRSSKTQAHKPEMGRSFKIAFPDGHMARALRVNSSTDTQFILKELDLTEKPCIFISGGAGGMSDADRTRVQSMIDAVADFANNNGAVIIDGGTEAGVMKMVGDARHSSKHDFPLIGVAPLGKIAYPGYSNPDQEAELEDGHSHFVLVEGEEWGDETDLIVGMMEALRDGSKLPGVVILINGGSIALKEVHLATTKQLGLPTLVLEGSGRAADELSTAFRSGKTSRKILKAILDGGDIVLLGVDENPDSIKARLREHFKNQRSGSGPANPLPGPFDE